MRKRDIRKICIVSKWFDEVVDETDCVTTAEALDLVKRLEIEDIERAKALIDKAFKVYKNCEKIDDIVKEIEDIKNGKN